MLDDLDTDCPSCGSKVKYSLGDVANGRSPVRPRTLSNARGRKWRRGRGRQGAPRPPQEPGSAEPDDQLEVVARSAPAVLMAAGAARLSRHECILSPLVGAGGTSAPTPCGRWLSTAVPSARPRAYSGAAGVLLRPCSVPLVVGVAPATGLERTTFDDSARCC